MNKKLVYFFAVLATILFVISACNQDAVGRRVVNRNIVGDEETPNSWVTLNITANPQNPELTREIFPNSGAYPINDSGYTTINIQILSRGRGINYTFANWSGDIRDIRGFNISSSNRNYVPMNRNRNIVANFR